MRHDERLRHINILSGLSEEALQKIRSISSIITYPKGSYIFKERQKARYLFAVIKGKVGLEVNCNSSQPCIVKHIYPNKVFGISSVTDTQKRATVCHAKALETTEVVRWSGRDMEALFETDYDQAFIFMRNVCKVLKNRLMIQRTQMAKKIYSDQAKSA